MAARKSHVGTDWRDEWAHLQRRHQALASIAGGQFADKDVAVREVLDFFRLSHQLGDWVIGSRYRTRRQVEALRARTPALLLAADIANGTKHFRLEPRRARFDSTWSTATESVTVISTIEGGQRITTPEPGSRWVITTSSGAYDFFDLADKCLAAWRGFL